MHLDINLLSVESKRKGYGKRQKLDKAYRKSAVLILINDNKIFFIQRAQNGDAHSGQIAFPGGKFNYTDITLRRTALRETKEELGINPKQIKIITKLNEISIPVSRHRVMPFVGYSKEQLILKPNKAEVERVIPVYLSTLLNTDKTSRKIEVRGKEEYKDGYVFDDIFVWGATAKILDDFIVILKRACK